MSAHKPGPLKEQLHLLGEGPVLLVEQPIVLEVATFAVADEVEAESCGRIADADSVLEALLEEGDLLLETVSVENEFQLEDNEHESAHF